MKAIYLPKLLNTLLLTLLLVIVFYSPRLEAVFVSPIPKGKEHSFKCNDSATLKIKAWIQEDDIYWNIVDFRNDEKVGIRMIKQSRAQLYSTRFFNYQDPGNANIMDYEIKSSNFPDKSTGFTIDTAYKAILNPNPKSDHSFIESEDKEIQVTTLVGPLLSFRSPTLGVTNVHLISEIVKGPGERLSKSKYRYDPNRKSVIHIGWSLSESKDSPKQIYVCDLLK